MDARVFVLESERSRLDRDLRSEGVFEREPRLGGVRADLRLDLDRDLERLEEREEVDDLPRCLRLERGGVDGDRELDDDLLLAYDLGGVIELTLPLWRSGSFPLLAFGGVTHSLSFDMYFLGGVTDLLLFPVPLLLLLVR